MVLHTYRSPYQFSYWFEPLAHSCCSCLASPKISYTHYCPFNSLKSASSRIAERSFFPTAGTPSLNASTLSSLSLISNCYICLLICPASAAIEMEARFIGEHTSIIHCGRTRILFSPVLADVNSYCIVEGLGRSIVFTMLANGSARRVRALSRLHGLLARPRIRSAGTCESDLQTWACARDG